MTTLPQTTGVRMPRPAGGGALAMPGQQGQPIPPAGMTAGDVWRVIRANTLLIVGLLVLGVAAGLGINYYLARNYSRYTATGWTQISEKRTQNGETALDMSTLATDLRTQATLLQRDTLLNSVLDRPAVRETSWFKHFIRANAAGVESADVAAARADLAEKLSVSPLLDSKLIQIQFSCTKPEDCATIVSELVEQHLQDQTSYRSQQLRNRTQDLNLTKNNLTVKNNRLKEDIAKLQDELNRAGITTTAGTSMKYIELQMLADQVKTARVSISEAQSALKALDERLKQGIDPVEIDIEVQNDPRIQSARQQVDQIQQFMNSNSSYGPNNPRTQSLQQELARAQQRLDDLEAERRVKLREELKDKFLQQQQMAESTLASVLLKLEDNKNELGQLDYKLFVFNQQKEDQRATQTAIDNIDKNLQTISVEMQGKELASIDWAGGGKPQKPETPSFPKLPVTMFAAVGIALALGLGIAFGRELMDQSVRSPRDISRVGQMNFLGMIPHEDDDPQVTGVPLPLVIFQAPTSMIAEQLRQVRTRLQQASSLETTRSLLVTSPGPGDGKSTIATNLAAGLALNGRRVLLVDGNFRRPQLHKIFNVGNEMGFSSALAAMENFETAVHQTNVMNLDVLPTGPKPANPTELMESQLLIDFIEKALEEYDHVVFDSGPLLFVSETVALAPRVDGVITVVRARANSRGLLQRMRDTLRQLKAEHLGIILNGVRSQGGGYYGRNIKTYYEYQNGHA